MHDIIYWRGQKIDPSTIDPDILYLIESFLFNPIKATSNHNSYAKERARLRITLFGEENSAEFIDNYLCCNDPEHINDK